MREPGRCESRPNIVGAPDERAGFGFRRWLLVALGVAAVVVVLGLFSPAYALLHRPDAALEDAMVAQCFGAEPTVAAGEVLPDKWWLSYRIAVDVPCDRGAECDGGGRTELRPVRIRRGLTGWVVDNPDFISMPSCAVRS